MVNELSKPYLVTLYANVETLNSYLAFYNNILLQINNKYANIERPKLLQKIDATEKNQLIQIINTIRSNSIIIFVKISAIKPTVKDFVTDEIFNQIKEHHQIITTEAVPEYEKTQEYIILINSLFISGIGAEISRAGQEYYSNLSNINAGGYNETTNDNETTTN